MKNVTLIGRRGIGGIVSWFIQLVIYDICVTGIQNALGVSRIVALFIFFGILAVIAFAGYMFRQQMASGVDD